MRHRIPAAIVSVFFVFVIAGLFYTQIIRYGYYARLSQKNSIRVLSIDGPRGTMYDRGGAPIVTNRLSFDVAIIYDELRNRSGLAKLLRSVVGMSKRDVIAALRKAAKKPYVPVTVAPDIPKEKAIILEEAAIDIPGLVIQTRSTRSYPYATAAGHLIGYLSEISEAELMDLEPVGYRRRDLLGRDGLEKYYESYLRGIDGGTQIEVDNRGRQVRVLGIKEPTSGRDLYLTIDMPLQLACEDALGDRRGVVVALDPRTGEVLALASHPSYDPNVFIDPAASGKRVAYLRDDWGRPLSNRAIAGQYPPGSVFKIVTAAAALETRAIDAGTQISCGGTFHLGRASFNCWKKSGHGPQNIVAGLMNSCNVFFYQAGRRAGVDAIERYAKLFGYGRPSGIDLPHEREGVVPGKAWKRAAHSAPWYEGDTVNYAIGQGYLLVTPIQVAVMTGVVASDGILRPPFIVKSIGRSGILPGRARRLGLKKETLQLIQRGMRNVVNGVTGTARRAQVEGLTVAGKTGTAQNPQGRTHAWFTGFAPYDDPRLCVTVFLEHGGKGSAGPTEIAHTIFETAKARGLL